MFHQTEPRGVPRWLPPTHIIAALALGGIVFAITVSKGVIDPDYFWHVTTGGIIVESGVPNADPYSFTWFGQPWTPHEWLSELLMFVLVSTLGETGALAVWALLPGATLVVTSLTLARLGARTLAQVPVLTLMALLIAPYSTLRPQAISWLFLAIVVALLVTVTAENRRRLLFIAPIFLLWANFHGLYVLGIGVLVAYAAFTLMGRTALAPHRAWAVGAVALAGIAAMLTPAGPLGVLYPLRYRQEWGLANIQEWQSPDFHNPAHWALLGLVLWLILNGGRAAPGWLQAIAYVGTLMALVALRNTPVAAVLAAPTLAIGLEARLMNRFGPARTAAAKAAMPRRVMEIVLAGIVVAGSFVIFLPRGLGVDPDDLRREAGYPLDAVELLRGMDEVQVVAEYGWAGFVINQLYEDGARVFVDGRNDMYPEEILDEYTSISMADAGWEEILDDRGANALLFPPSKPIVKGIAQNAGWCEAHRDDDSVLLLRDCDP
jgi:hypothetical protein